MGSRNKVLLASLVSMVMMLSFAIGLVPAAVDNSLTGASAAAPAVAITADGATPAGDSLTLTVGDSISFSALGADAAVDWSLASDGSAELVDAGASATVVARAPGEAGLYLSSASGVDLVNLTIVDGAKQGGAGAVTTLTPQQGSTILVPTGSDTVPFTLTAAVATGSATVTYERVDDPNNPQDVEVLGSSSTPPYAVAIPNLLEFIRGVGQVDALYAWIAADHVYTSFNIAESELDEDGNALPDNPFLMNLGPGDSWIALQTGTSRQVMIVPLVDNFDKQFSLDGDGAIASLSNPANPDQKITAFAPAGLIAPDEIGYMILVVANSLEDLLDAGGDGTDINAFPGDPIAGSRFADVSIIVSGDGGASFSEIETPLASNVVIRAEGVATVAGDAVRMFSYESEVTEPPVFINAQNGFLWTAIPNTLVQTGAVTASTNTLSVFAPFSSGDALTVTSIVNTTSGSALEGTSQARATGGDTLEITATNVAAGTANNAVITIEGKEVAYSAAVSGETVQYTVAAPQADPLAEPAESNAVPVVVAIGSDADQGTLTYVGPTNLTIAPTFGPVEGGTPVVITGSGLTGSTVTVGGSPLIGASVTSTQATGTTPPGQAGSAEVRAAYAALGYFGSVDGGFLYLGAAPTISVNPMSVFSDGGYTIRVTAAENGGRFLDPSDNAENEIYFTQNSGDELGDGADPANDIPSGPVTFIDDRTLEVLTPDITGLRKQAEAVTLYNVYWTTSAYSATVSKQEDPNAGLVSNFVKDFAFVDPDQAAYRIDTINPNFGPAEGGNSVVLTGDFGGLEDPFQEGPPPPPTPQGRQTFFGAVFVEGEEIEFAPTQFNAQPGDRFELTLFHSVALDKQVGAPPASLTFAVSWDPAVLTVPNPNPAQGFNPVRRSQLLIDWYNKGLDVNYGQRAQGRLPIVLSGGSTFTPDFTTVSTSITTCNNQLPVIDEDDCSEQQNPFPLITIIFDVVGAAGSSSSLTLADYAGADRNGAPTGSPEDGLGTMVSIGGGGKQNGNGDPGYKVTFFDVSFGPLAANVEQAGFLPSDPETDAIEVIAPDARADAAANAAFGQGLDYTVDVRVEGPDIDNDPTQFAIAAGGYTYEGGPLREITGITPSSGWVFGSEELTIEGQGFIEGTEGDGEVVVTFTLDDILDGEGEPIVLEAAIQGEIADDAIVVTVPPLVVDGQPIDLTTRTTTATVAVDFGEEKKSAEEAGTFTYVKWDVTGTEATGQVTTNAFIFLTGEGFSTGEDGFVFDGPAEQEKSWADPLTDVPGATTGIVTIPALPPAFKDSTDLVFGILRVTRTGELFGISDDPPSSDPFPGEEIDNIFNFDLHLYQGEDLSEFYVEYDATEVDSADDLPSIIYNVENTSLTRAMIATGGVSTWSRPTTFDFTFGNRSLTIPPVPGEKDERIPAAMRPSTYALEAQLITEDTAPANENDPVLAVRTRLQNLGAGSFALRSGQQPPRELWEGVLGTTGADRTIAPTGGNREIIVTGRYIYWSTDLYIVPQGQSPSAANSTPIEDRFRDEEGRDVLVATAPDLEEGEYDLYVQMPTAGQKQVAPFLIEGQLIVDGDPRPRPDLSGLLAILGTLFAAVLGGGVALLGLLAGGDSSSSGGPCFIATAAYGSPMATEIEVLRTIRDSYLLSNPLGSAFVDVYYRVSPALADVVAQSPVLAAVVRLLLLPVLFAGKMLVSMPIVSIGLLSLSLALASLRRRFSRGM